MQIAQYIGWLLTLAIVIVTVGHFTKALIVLVRSSASDFEQVSGDDAFRAIIRASGDLIGLLLQRRLATVCSVAMLLTLHLMGVDGFASFGYSAITFVIAGLATRSDSSETRLSQSNSSDVVANPD